MQERPGFVDRQVEALDEDARGVERSIVAALAGDGRRNLGQIGCGTGQSLDRMAPSDDTVRRAFACGAQRAGVYPGAGLVPAGGRVWGAVSDGACLR